MSGHYIVPPATYRKVLIVLMVLMLATIVAAKWQAMDISIAINLIIALAIAFTKMSFIMTFFMHVKYSSRLVQIFALSGLFWLAIMMVFTFNDYLSRNWNSPWTPDPYAAPVAADAAHASAAHGEPAPEAPPAH